MVEGLASRDSAGPGNDEGNMHAAFGQHALFAVERVVEAAVPAAGSPSRGESTLWIFSGAPLSPM